MNIEVTWTDETRRILHVLYQPGWSWDDHFAMAEPVQSMLDSVSHPVDLILNLQDTKIPGGAVGQFPALMQRSASLNHANTNRIVLVGAAAYLKTLFSLFQKVYPQVAQRATVYDTVFDALAALNEPSN